MTLVSYVPGCHLEDLGGSTPFDRIGDAIPSCVLDLFGAGRVDADDAVLLPSLVPHAVEHQTGTEAFSRGGPSM